MPRFSSLLMLAMGMVAVQACADEASEVAELVDESSTLLAVDSPSCRLQEIVAPSELSASERGAFNTEGRYFAIATRPDTAPDAGAWIVEVKRAPRGYAAVNYLAGTLEGTHDGTLDGAPRGDACLFSGMASYGDLLYAGCYALDGRVSLLRVDTKQRTVRAGAFTTCTFEPATKPCKPVSLYPNGMATDAAGRVYTTDMTVHLAGGHASPPYSIAQITVEADAGAPGELRFRHRTWLVANLALDGISPNGIQIERDVLYYVGGANVNAVPIKQDGSAGKARVHYRGPLLSYIDDFAVAEGEITLARTIPSAVVGLDSPPGGRSARAFVTCPMPDLGPPSSITYQPDSVSDAPLFPPGTLVITSFFGGGLFTLAPLR